MQYGSNFFQSTKQKPRKSSLPYPLPDPYATEIYDPHGLFQSKPREESIGGEISGLSLALEKAKAIHHEPQEPQFDSPTALSEFELDVNMKQSGIENVDSNNSNLYNISALANKLSETLISSPSSAPHSPRISSLSRLRIGSSSTATTNPPTTENQIGNTTIPVSIPIPSSPASIYRGRSDSVMRMDDEDDSRSRGSSPYADIAWSPAVGFLSSFGDIGLASETEHAIVAGDQEGFEVCGYTLGRELGVGGFGVVREAIKIKADEEEHRVAVKIVKHALPVIEKNKEEKDNLRRSLSGIRMGSRRTSMANESRSRSSSGSGSAIIFRRGFQDLSNSFSSLPPPFPTSPTADPTEIIPPLPLPTDPLPIAPHQSLLEREIALWQNLPPHPHIVPLLDVHHNFDYSYIFMPLCEGGNLLTYLNDYHKSKSTISTPTRGRAGRKSLESSLLGLASLEEGDVGEVKERKGLPLSKCLPIFAQIVSGLHHLHTVAHITHKDIKLENILCDEKGVGGTWKIADFGLAETGVPSATPTPLDEQGPKLPFLRKEDNPRGHRQFTSESGPSRHNQSALGRSSSLSVKPTTALPPDHDLPAGSLPYSAPEVVSPRIGEPAKQAADIWALGCVLYAMVEGKLPFEDTYEPRLRMKILGAQWEVPQSLLPSTPVSSYPPPSPSGEMRSQEVEKSQILEILENTLEPDPTRRWSIRTIAQSPWISSSHRSASRGRAARRPPVLTFTDSKVSSSAERSPSEFRRPSRSTSRGPATHYGIDPRTRSLERKEVKKWSGKSESNSRIGSRSGSRSRETTNHSGERLGRGTEPY